VGEEIDVVDVSLVGKMGSLGKSLRNGG